MKLKMKWLVLGLLVLGGTVPMAFGQAEDVKSSPTDTAKAKQLLTTAKELIGKGKYDEAEVKLNEAGSIFEKVMGKEFIENADVLHQKGRIWILKGDYDQGILFTQLGLDIRLKFFGAEYPDVAVSYNNLGSCYYNKGDYDKSIGYHEKALNIRLKVLGLEHPDVAASYNNLGNCYAVKGDYGKSIGYHEKALNIRLKVLGSEHPDVAYSYNNLGNCYLYKGDYDNSISYYEQALNIWLKTLGSEHPDVADSYNNLGNCYYDKGEYEKSIDYHEKALNIILKVLGAEHPDVAGSYNNLGNCYIEKGDYDKSIGYHEKALNIRLKVLGSEHPDVAASYENLGICYLYKGDYAKSIGYHEKALNIRLKVLGTEHPDVAASYENLGNCYNNKGEYDKSIEYYEKALNIKLKVLGSEHPAVADSYNNLGICYDEKGDYDKSIGYHEKALKIRLKTLGSEHPAVSASYNNLGSCYNDKGEYEKSIGYHEKALKIRLKVLGSEHPDVAASYNNLGICYYEKGDYDKSIDYLKKTLNIRLKALGVDHPDVAGCYNNLAVFYNDKGEYDKSIDYHEKALNIMLKTLGAEHPDVAGSYNNLGSCYSDKRDYNNSISYHEKALNIRLKTLGSEHPDVAASYNNLGNCNVYTGDYTQANALYSKALDASNYHGQNLKSVNSFKQLLWALFSLSQVLERQYSSTRDHSYLEQSLQKAQEALAAIDYQTTTFDSESSKTHWQSKNQGIYEQAIDISLLQAEVDQNTSLRSNGFTYSEKSKASQLKAQLKNAAALAFSGIPDSLTQKEYQLRLDLTWREKQRQTLLDGGKSETDSIVLGISSSLFALRQEYEGLKKRFEKNYPDYYRLKYDLATVPFEYVQDSLLKADESLLEYFVGDSSIYIFLVQPQHYEVVEVKKDTAFEQWVEDLTRNGIYGFYGKKGTSKGKSINNFGTAAYKLYEALIAPIKAKLPKDEKLIIIPDGILGYVPFESLLTQKPPRPDAISAYKYLIQDHQISYCYSATLLKEMRNKKHRQEPSQKLLAMAPFFLGNADTLLSKVDSTELLADVALRTRDTLTALPSSGPEVASINKIIPGQAFYGREATLQKFQELASGSRILHLSTHGKADDRLGDYAYLAFGMPNAEGTFDKLYARDLYNLSLNADLVVLSACETGIGKLQRGEGIVSLARAFAYAGAKSIVTTLWKVSDEQSKNLMSSFYKYLSKGKEKDEALRLAKLDFLKANEKRTELLHPFFWASFIGIGDMRGLENSK